MNKNVFCPLKDYNNCGNCSNNCRGQRQIVEGNDFIYIVNGKSASTSIINIIGVKSKFVNLDYIEKSTKFKFTFVRNPWSRLVSGWASWINVKRPWLDTHNKLNYKMPFPDFIKVLALMPDYDMNLHFAPQTIYTKHCDFVGKVENLNTDWEYISNKFSLSKIKHLGKSGVKNHFDIYNKETAKLVFDRYNNEIIEFDYEKLYDKWKNI